MYHKILFGICEVERRETTWGLKRRRRTPWGFGQDATGSGYERVAGSWEYGDGSSSFRKGGV